MRNIVIAITALALIGFWLFASQNHEAVRVEAIDDMGNIEEMSVSSSLDSDHMPNNPNLNLVFDTDNLEEIYLAGGCFWGLEAYMSRIPGVYDVTSGYANGNTEDPSYEDLIYRNSGHAETVHILYDPKLVTLDTILTYYFNVIDPTSLNKQGNDRGTQYRTGIYFSKDMDLKVIDAALEQEQMKYKKDIVVEVEALEHYYLAETYHQDYLDKNPNGYCHIDLDSVPEDLSIYTKPSDDEIKEMLTPLQYKVTQEGGTERAFQNEYWDNKESGIYVDIVTGEPLFSSKDKYKSGTGWPSFTKPIEMGIIKEEEDNKLFVTRTEIKSLIGDSHLGHVFNDGPIDKGGLRYCVNSAALKFIAEEDMEEMGYGHLLYLFE